MAQPTRLSIAKKDIFDVFENAPKKVYTQAEIARILTEHRDFWRLAQRTNAHEFIAFLIDQKRLIQIDLTAPNYPTQNTTRYAWGKVSAYELALALRKSAYLSHGTAVYLHGLTELIPKTIYLNAEQSVKPPPKGGLTQAGLDRAFSNNQRQSKLTFDYEDWNITVINGKNTARLGVEEIRGPSGERLEATGIERTLVDIAVRPAYAGGVNQVLAAFRSAKENASINKMAALLKQLDYIYPYHQVIGFYLQNAGYEENRYQPLLDLGLNFDFYLTHGIKKPKLDERWRVYYPEGLSLDASSTTKSK